MNRTIRSIVAAAGLAIAAMPTIGAGPVSTQFTYQGELKDAGSVANGAYDFQFKLFDAAVAGVQKGATLTPGDVPVVDGRFSTALDFGTQFDGTALWLEIAVRDGASVGAYTTLGRQAMTATPYAMGVRLPLAQSASGTNGLVTLTNTSTANSGYVMKLISGAGSGNASGLTYQPVLVADTNDGNGIASFVSSSGGYAMYARSEGSSGTPFVGENAANSGRAAYFSIETLTNSSTALESETAGLGRAGFFNSTNDDSEVPTLYARNIATGESIPGGSQENGIAIKGEATGGFGLGVMGVGPKAGVFGYSGATGGAGVYGKTGGGGGSTSAGVRGDGNGAGTSAVAAFNNLGTALYAQSTSGVAGFFSGDVTITGNLSKGSGSFKIDHPMDPENKFLVHSFVESPDMKNIYDGVVTLNEKGEATVTLPDYFNSLNVDYRYQLTCIGGYAPVFISSEIKDNTFAIAGGRPGLKVSWAVTGIRNDPFARKHRLPVEEMKSESERGLYLHPDAYGQPASKQLGVPAGLREAAKSN